MSVQFFFKEVGVYVRKRLTDIMRRSSIIYSTIALLILKLEVKIMIMYDNYYHIFEKKITVRIQYCSQGRLCIEYNYTWNKRSAYVCGG